MILPPALRPWGRRNL